jgi:hypothetical protein
MDICRMVAWLSGALAAVVSSHNAAVSIAYFSFNVARSPQKAKDDRNESYT